MSTARAARSPSSPRSSARPNSTWTRPEPSSGQGTWRDVGGRFFAPGLPGTSTASVTPESSTAVIRPLMSSTEPAEQVTGRITAVDDAGVTLAVEAKGKPGAKKKPPQPREVPWPDLGPGRVQVEFGRHEPEAGGEPQDATAQPDPADDNDGGGQ